MIEYSICFFRAEKLNLKKENNMKIGKNTETHYTLHLDIRKNVLKLSFTLVNKVVEQLPFSNLI